MEEFNKIEECFYSVSGTVFCIKSNTELSFDKKFESEESANKYLKKMAGLYPISTIILNKKIEEEILIYI